MTTLTHDDCFPFEARPSRAAQVVPSALLLVHHGGEVRMDTFLAETKLTHCTRSVSETEAILEFVTRWLTDQQGRRIPPPDGPEEAA